MKMFEVKEFYDQQGSSAVQKFQDALNSELGDRQLLSWRMGVGGENDTFIVAIFQVRE